MRILLYSGKGGVGKTSVAAATGLRLAQLGYRTLIMSVDPAHSLADSFDLKTGLFHADTSEPLLITDGLEVLEVNIQKEIKRHWREISAYVIGILRTSGIGNVEAEEMAIFPGMEELSALMYVNQFRREDRYDVIVLDCAPTAESLRFVSMPTTLEWYMKHIFPMQRNILRAVRPVANRMSPVELPADSYFANVKDLFDKLDGIEDVLEDAEMTSVRLVTNPEKMVLRETQRAFVYFLLHGLTVDNIIVNRVLPSSIGDDYFAGWLRSQAETMEEIRRYFDPVRIHTVPFFAHEVVGRERLQQLADLLYPEGEDPALAARVDRPYSFHKESGVYQVRVKLPFAAKGEVGLFKKGEELVVEIGTLRRHIGLPASMTALQPARARLEESVLTVEMKEV
ncbi:MAG: ArsA family ATPase [Bryobacterales bacterium]|nr:ArsA family ATPase [Bryobacterales bacterium]